MKNRIILFSVLISYFVAFIFLTLVSLELNNRGIQTKETLLEEQINVMKQLEGKDKIVSYLADIGPNKENNIYILLQSNKILYSNTFEKDTMELIKLVHGNEDIVKNKSTKNAINTKKIDQDFMLTENLDHNLLFIGAYKTNSVLKITSHFFPYFIVSGAIGSLLLYILFSYIMQKNQSEAKYLIRSFKKYVRDADYAIDLNPYTAILSSDIRREAKDMRRKIESLQSRLNGLNDMIVNMTEGVILVGKDRKIISINEAAVKLVDASIHINYQGKDLLYLCREMNFYKTFSVAFDNLKVVTNKIRFGDKIVKVYLNPVFTVEKEFFGMMLLLIDETAATVAEQQRREFTSNVTHELKTPLTSIRGYTELLRTGGVKDADRDRFLDIILSESQRLFDLIDAIISMSRLEEKNKIEEYEIVDIYSVVQELIVRHRAQIDAKEIDVTIFPAVDNKLYTHKVIMTEILWNLINNAVVYNVNKGWIKITLISNQKDMEIVIEDKGIGISYNDQKRIFERFYMVDKSRSYNKKSTGLGLAIVKHNVENLQGEIELKSQIKEGTRFNLKFPKKEYRSSQ